MQSMPVIDALRVLTGAVFEEDSTILKTALTYGIQKYNNDSRAEIRIDPYEKQVDQSDTVDLTEKGEAHSTNHHTCVSV